MPLIFRTVIGWLIGAIGLSLSTYVGRVLIALGISYVTYTGIGAGFGTVKTQIFGLLNATGDLQGIIGMSRIGESVNIVFSALAARLVLSGLSGGSMTKIKLK